MKNNAARTAGKIAGIAALAVIGSNGIIWLLDHTLDGMLKEWFFRFVYLGTDRVLTEAGWYRLKSLFGICLTAAILLLVFGCIVSARLYARYQKRLQAEAISRYLTAMAARQDPLPPFPADCQQIERQPNKRAEETQRARQLAQQEMQRKSDLITYLAHDLKTPLSSVIGYLSLLDECPDLPLAQRAKYTGITLEKANRLEQLINEFFDIIRFNLQTIPIHYKRIQLPFMLAQMADEFYPLLTPGKKTIQIDAPDSLVFRGDPDKLARVFHNILKNAIAYSDPGSTIVIRAREEKEQVILTFTNRGSPIPPHKLETIFEKFYRLDSSRSGDTGGSGLGLAIAKEIVLAHGGDISVESHTQQTTFTVSLPLDQPDETENKRGM